MSVLITFTQQHGTLTVASSYWLAPGVKNIIIVIVIIIIIIIIIIGIISIITDIKASRYKSRSEPLNPARLWRTISQSDISHFCKFEIVLINGLYDMIYDLQIFST